MPDHDCSAAVTPEYVFPNLVFGCLGDQAGHAGRFVPDFVDRSGAVQHGDVRFGNVLKLNSKLKELLESLGVPAASSGSASCSCRLKKIPRHVRCDGGLDVCGDASPIGECADHSICDG